MVEIVVNLVVPVALAVAAETLSLVMVPALPARVITAVLLLELTVAVVVEVNLLLV